MADNSESEFTKHPILWLDYGNTVIIAEDTAFKMPDYLLAVSEVFRDMFKIAKSSAPDEAEMFEGLPLLTLHDSADDVAALFDALAHGLRIPKRNFKHSAYVRAILSLSHKYMIQMFRPVLEQHLREQYPSTLADYDRRIVLDQQFISTLTNTSDNTPLIYNRAMDIAVAHKVGLHDVLPCAFYDLCYSILNKDRGLARLNGLSLEDTHRLITGKEELDLAMEKLFAQAIARDCPRRGSIDDFARGFIDLEDFEESSIKPNRFGASKATGDEKCSTVIAGWRTTHEHPIKRSPGPLAILQELEEATKTWPERQPAPCWKCRTALTNFYKAGRELLWIKLASAFSLSLSGSAEGSAAQTASVFWDHP